MFPESGGTLNGSAYHSRKVVFWPSSQTTELSWMSSTWKITP